MVENTQTPRSRVTPSQWLLIGILAVILIGVLIVQFKTADASPSPIDPSTVPVPASRRPAGVNGAAGNQGLNGRPAPLKLQGPWPGIPLSTVLQYDPFAQMASLAPAKSETQPGTQAEASAVRRSEDAAKKHADRQRAIADLRQEVVRAVIGTDKGYVAVVGARTIRTGDRLHGLLVKKITPDGVVLELTKD